MQEPQEATDTAPTRSVDTGMGATLLRVAWLAILLGFAMEPLLLLFADGFGIVPGLVPGLGSTVSDLGSRT